MRRRPLAPALEERARARSGDRCEYCGTALGPDGAAFSIHPTPGPGPLADCDVVVCCAVCNASLESYPRAQETLATRLLNPLQDNVGTHVTEADDGSLVGRSPEGRLYIDRLRLNRPALIAAGSGRVKQTHRQQDRLHRHRGRALPQTRERELPPDVALRQPRAGRHQQSCRRAVRGRQQELRPRRRVKLRRV